MDITKYKMYKNKFFTFLHFLKYIFIKKCKCYKIYMLIQVHQVEEEMRGLLEETCKNKKAMEIKIKQLAFALNQIQQEM